TVTEGDAGVTNATFTLQLSEISERPVSVKVSTRDGTAISGEPDLDYEALVNFPALYQAGDTTRQLTFSVPVRGDVLAEGNETFSVVLSGAEFATIGSTTTGTVTITDNDPAPVISVNDVSVQEGNGGTTDLVFTVSLSAASGRPVEVDFKTGTGGTASATGPLADYVAKSGTLKFLPGELTKEVRVKV